MTRTHPVRRDDDAAAAPAAPVSPWQSVTTPGAQQRRRRLLLAVTLLLGLQTALFGFPTGRELVIAYLLAYLYALCAGDLVAWRRAVLQDWLPFIAVLFGYDLLRGQADGLGGRLAPGPALVDDRGRLIHAFVTPQLDVDRWLFGGHVPTVWLQQHLYSASTVHWYDIVIVPVYFSHFLIPTAAAGLLWARSYAAFRRFIWAFVVLTGLTLATYAAYPAAPPWLASLNGFLPPGVDRVVSHTLVSTGVGTVKSVVERGQAYSNEVAAVPSLHAAVPVLILLLSWRWASRWLRAVLVLYPLLMAFTLVYSGEHYVSDVLLGWAFAAVSVAVSSRVLGRQRATLTSSGPPPG